MVSVSLTMLEESLEKKIRIMALIEEENEKQQRVLSNYEEVDEEAFDDTIYRKSDLIDQLLALDDGFETLFERVKEEIGENKTQYSDQIKRMQVLIKEITAKSASIEAMEHRNKKLAEKYFSAAREHMNQSRSSSSAAFNYYQTMNNFKNIPPQFIDKKN